MKFLITLILLFYSVYGYPQTAPSEPGAHCIARGVYGYGKTYEEAAQDACFNFGAADGSNVSYTPPRYCDTVHEAGSFVMPCGSSAVCLTGQGYEPADSGGYCPDPDTDEEGDDEDDDGNDCDAGESGQVDCNDGDDDDEDSDDDDDPDSKDPDDGICFDENYCAGCVWLGEEPSDPDCGEEEEQCPSDAEGLSYGYAEGETIYNLVCDDPTNCQFTKCGGLNIEIGTQTYVSYCPVGKECDGTEEQEGACPDGQHEPVAGEGCVTTENFCELDEHTNGTEDGVPDGIPDNQDTFACRSDAEEDCDPANEECDGDSAGLYACEDQVPPECDSVATPVQCAQLEHDWKTTCGVQFTDVFDCELEFICTGNPIECASLELKQKQYCASQLTEEEAANPDSLDNVKEGIDDGTNYFGGEDVDGSIVDISDLMDAQDDSGFGLPRQCPNNETISILGKSYTFEFSKSCNLFEIVGVFFLLFGAFLGFQIIAQSLL